LTCNGSSSRSIEKSRQSRPRKIEHCVEKDFYHNSKVGLVLLMIRAQQLSLGIERTRLACLSSGSGNTRKFRPDVLCLKCHRPIPGKSPVHCSRHGGSNAGSRLKESATKRGRQNLYNPNTNSGNPAQCSESTSIKTAASDIFYEDLWNIEASMETDQTG
jgi:hypothetical protein